MKRKNSTRNALVTSVISLLLCVSMLVGTTFAWFTDEVKSANNIIKSGNLDVTLEYWDGTSWNNVQGSSDILTGNLWEPGYVDVAYLRLKNAGSLALKYQLGVNIVSETGGINQAGSPFVLSDYIYFDVIEGVNGQTSAYATRGDAMKVATENTKISAGYSKAGSLEAGSGYVYLAMVVHMPTTVTNDANHNGTSIPQIDLGINVFATQYTSESDSFDKYYDYMGEGGITSADAPAAGTTEEYAVYSAESNVKIVTMNISADSVNDADKPIEISIVPTTDNANVTINPETQEADSYEITVSNIKENNETPIKVQLNIGTGKSGVNVYHNGALIESTYNENTGIVTFYTTSFSPYTVVYDANPVVEDEGGEQPSESNLPKATVVNSTEYENVDLPWGSYGAWSPTAGLDSQLEAAYTFSCVDSLDEAKASPYANWYCDFYVKLDKDLGENQIFLGGNYGSFGWVGFHNGDLTLEANNEIPLLGSVTSSPWTYLDVVQNVGTFICGVGDVDDALAGATFTVMLRLTNPADANEFYNVSTIEYTFEERATVVSSSEELANAIADGKYDLYLNAGTYNMPTAAQGKTLTISGSKDAVIEVVPGGQSEANGQLDYSLDGSTVTFNGVTIKTNSQLYAGFARLSAVYNNCVIQNTYNLGVGISEFNNCTFNITNEYLRVGGAYSAAFNGCTFNTDGRAILIFQDGTSVAQTVTVKDCTFNATAAAQTWNGIHVAAVSYDGSQGGTYIVNFEGNNVVDSNFNGLWQIKNGEANVTVNGLN